MSSSNKIVLALCLAALGIAGNYFALPISFSVEFIFGSIFSILAIGILGPWWGAGVTVAASSYTCILWNHPYALIIFTAEALWLGYALRRNRSNIVLIDGAYWLTVGWLLVAVFYAGIMHVNFQGTLTVILKQAINGLFNSLVASMLLVHTPLRNLARKEEQVTYAQLIFHTVCSFLMIPSLILVYGHSHRVVASLEKIAAERVSRVTAEIEVELAEWLGRHLDAAQVIAELGSSQGVLPSATLQQELERIKELLPDFHIVFLADGNGVTVGCFPPRNEFGTSAIGRSFADRPYYQQLVATKKPVVSDVFSGHAVIFKPLFTVVVPVVRDGKISHFGLGGINLERLRARFAVHALQQDMIFTVLDGKGNVVITTDSSPKQSVGAPPVIKPTQTRAVTSRVSLYIPGARRNTSPMLGWKGAYYFSSAPIKGTNWTLLVQCPTAPMQKQLYASTITELGTIALLFLLMVNLASVISKRLTRPLLALARVSRDIPAKIEQRAEISWVGSSIGEVALLEENFRKTAQALREKINNLVQRFTFALNSAEIGVWDWLVLENRLIWDRQMHALYGLEGTELDCWGYQAWKNGVHPEDRERCDRAIQQALEGEKEFDIEFRVVWPSGVVRDIKAHALVLRDADGTPLRMIGVNWDITAQRQVELAYLAAKEKAEAAYLAKSETLHVLEQEIGERRRVEESLRVSEARLQASAEQMKKMNEETQQRNVELKLWLEQEIREGREKDAILIQQEKLASLGQLAAGVAHEINNPMSFVMSNLGTLKVYTMQLAEFITTLQSMAVRSLVGSEQVLLAELSQKHDIGYILEDMPHLISESSEGARRVKHIVQDLKDFARTDEKEPGPVDINYCVESTLNILRNEIKYVAEVDLQLGELSPVVCVAGQINQVIANLIMNAVHAIEHHGTITLVTRHDGDQVLLEVSDTGHGMSEEVLKRIFDPFFTTKKVGEGTGLGLSITHAIVRKHGGEISVLSKPGSGTTFTVRLPTNYSYNKGEGILD